MSKSKALIVTQVEKYDGDVFAVHFSDGSFIMLSGAELTDCVSGQKRQAQKTQAKAG